MKKIILFLVLFISTNSNAQYFKNAKEYLAYIITEESNVSTAMWNYSKSVAHAKDKAIITTAKNTAVRSIQDASVRVRMLNGFNGDTSYQNEVLTYFSTLENYINGNYNELLLMNKTENFVINDQKVKDILNKEKLNTKLFNDQQKLLNLRKTFATNHSIRLEEKQKYVYDKMQKAMITNNYHTKFFSFFYPCNVLDEKLSNAIASEDVQEIKIQSEYLLKYSQLGLEYLKTAEHFYKDYSLINELKSALVYYIDEVQNFVPLVLANIEAKQKFAITKTEFKKIPENKVTTAQVNEYNVKVRVFNEIKNKYQSMNKIYIAKSNEVVQKWDKAAEIFLLRHYPN